MKNLLELCGYEPEEIEKELPRVQKAFKRLRIGPEDIEVGKRRLREFYDIELMGVRKTLRLFIKELVSMVLAREEKKILIYSVLPSMAADLIGAVMLGSEDVYAGFPDVPMLFGLQAIFNRNIPQYEAAERHALIPGSAHCGAHQSTLGGLLLNVIPKPDLLIGWGDLCDEGPKLDGLYEVLFDIQVHVIDCYRDWNWEEAPEVPHRIVESFADNMRRATKKIGETAGVEVTDAMVMECVMDTMGFWQTFVKIEELVVKSDPVALSLSSTLMYLYILLSAVLQPENRPARREVVELLYKEAKERVKRGEGVSEKGAPRVIQAAQCSMVDPAIERMVRGLGLSIPLIENQLFYPEAEFTPTSFKVEKPEEVDPYEALAAVFLTQAVVCNVSMRLPGLIRACKKYNIDGVLITPQTACRISAHPASIVRDAIKKELNLPVLLLEFDVYDPRFYSCEQLRTRLESFAEIVKMAK